MNKLTAPVKKREISSSEPQKKQPGEMADSNCLLRPFFR